MTKRWITRPRRYRWKRKSQLTKQRIQKVISARAQLVQWNASLVVQLTELVIPADVKCNLENGIAYSFEMRKIMS
nr:unnamed protein product [Spirometra erinaceieuropaei]